MRARGDQQTVQKSTKGADFSRKVSEMRQIWEEKPVTKFQDGPENSANRPNCVQPIGGQKLPEVFGPTNGAKGKRL